MNVGPSILIVMNKFVKLLNNKLMGNDIGIVSLWLVMMQIVFYKAAHPIEMHCIIM